MPQDSSRTLLERRVRALRASSEEAEDSGEALSSDDASTDAASQTSKEGPDGETDTEEEDEDLEAEPSASLTDDLGSISFGALAKAQASLGKRKRGSDEPAAHDDAIRSLKERLHEIKSAKTEGTGQGKPARSGNSSTTREMGRTSKHAPAEMSSKRAVSRKREVVPLAKRVPRDPRFDPATGRVDELKVKRNYSFLQDYREEEIRLLKEELKKTEAEDRKSQLKRALMSMESKKKAQEAKDKEQEIIREHRKKEKELIKQGKKPFYLKKSEQKRLALVERYGHLKGAQLDRVVERRRKKQAAKERKNMPSARRSIDDQVS